MSKIKLSLEGILAAIIAIAAIGGVIIYPIISDKNHEAIVAECEAREPKHEWGEIYIFDKHEGDYIETSGCKEGKYTSKSECLDKTRYKTYKYDYEDSNSYYYVICNDDGSWDKNNISPYSTQDHYWANEE